MSSLLSALRDECQNAQDETETVEKMTAEDKQKTYAAFTDAVYDTLVNRVDRLGTDHDIQFSCQNDDWEAAWGPRTGIPLIGFMIRRHSKTVTRLLRSEGQTINHASVVDSPTYADMRNEVLWDEAREPDYRRILSQGPLVKKAAQFMLRTRLLGQFRTLPPSYSYRVSASGS
ncbi:hypothetical protein V8E54_011686 [Elaphomyces granulatus]